MQNVYLHDVNGDDTKGPDGSQWIVFLMTGETTPTTFDDVRIVGNRLGRIDRQAINVQQSTWYCRPEIGCDGTENRQPATDVVISHNRLSDIGGDGIVVNNADGALVEHNTVKGFNRRSTQYNAGIWPCNSDRTLVQFNDVSGGKGTKDGMAYDIDGGTVDTTFQLGTHGVGSASCGPGVLPAHRLSAAPRTVRLLLARREDSGDVDPGRRTTIQPSGPAGGREGGAGPEHRR